MKRSSVTASILLIVAFGAVLIAQVRDPRAGYSPPGGAGGGGGVESNAPNTWSAAQTIEYAPTTDTGGKLIIDSTADNYSLPQRWPVQFHDYIWSRDPGGLSPGNPRAGITNLGAIWTGTSILASLDCIGSLADGSWYARGPFDRSTASGGTVSYLGAYSVMLGIASDVDGPALSATTPPGAADGALFVGGTRTPGAINDTATSGIGKDGALYFGSAAAPPVTVSGTLQSPDRYLDPAIWRENNYTPAMSGGIKLYGTTTIAEIATPTGVAVTPQGTTGATTYGYRVAFLDASANTTLAASEVTTATGHATLDGTNFNRISFTRNRAARTVRVYRTTGGATQGIIANLNAPFENAYVDDTGLVGSGDAVPTLNTTGNLTVQGELNGSVMLFTVARANITVDDTMLNIGGIQMTTATPILGFRTKSAGSIVGISMNSGCNALTSASGTPRVQLYSGGSAISGCVCNFASALADGNTNRQGTVSFPRGTYTFSSATLGVALDLNGASIGTGNIDLIVQVYIQYD